MEDLLERGMINALLKDEYPGIQIPPLDLNPDASFANVENRLQMLIMNDSGGNARAAVS